MVPKGRVTKVGYVQDVLSAYEQLVYNVLWLAKPKVDLRGFKYPTLMSTVGEYKLVRASYDDLKNVSKLGKNTVIRIIETLIQKDCVEIEQLADIFKRQSTIYRVYSFKAVRLRRLQKDHIYAAKLGKTFSFVRPVQAVYSTPLDPGTIPDGDLGTMSVPGTKSVPSIEPGTMPVTGTTYKGIKFQGTKENLTTTIDSSAVYNCFADYAPMVDQEAVARLITTSVAIAPDLTTGELLAALQEKGLLVAKHHTEITNPAGFLLSVVPKCFLGAAFKLWRQRRREALRLEGLENEMQLKRDALDEQLRSVPSDNPGRGYAVLSGNGLTRTLTRPGLQPCAMYASTAARSSWRCHPTNSWQS